ncbi:histone acetyltransferase HAC12-like isoform X2 [Raphanus sativus]|nr:histone acetyltransferase HAC12-like isoform X2 [Raphanus sativus]XP_056848217.1 histone acetyltransferase HAC12-like isoform X2 [Raphanus sativus]
MNVQDHMSGHLSGQAPNQGTVPQNNNGNSQMQNLAVPSSAGAGTMVDPDVLKLRRHMLVLVFKILEERQPSPGDAASKAKYMEVARRLEVGLFKMANTKEEYANESTVESRLARIITGRDLKSSNPGHTNSSMVGTMVPTTTGLSHAGGNPSSMVTSSACASVVPMVDHDILKVREYMRTLVFSELDKRQPCPADDASKAKYLHVARRLEEGLFKTANTREDYLNESILDSRLATLIRGSKLNNQQNANSSPPGMMTTLAPEVSPETTMVREKVSESEDELETAIAENLKLMSLYS